MKFLIGSQCSFPLHSTSCNYFSPRRPKNGWNFSQSISVPFFPTCCYCLHFFVVDGCRVGVAPLECTELYLKFENHPKNDDRRVEMVVKTSKMQLKNACMVVDFVESCCNSKKIFRYYNYILFGVL